MSFHFSPTNKNRLKNIRKSFSSSISKSTNNKTQSNNLNFNFITNSALNRGETQTKHHHHHQKLMMISSPTTTTEKQKTETDFISNTNTQYKPSNLNLNSNHTMMPSVKSRLFKNISRTKEKILQGIGKTDRTSDENFDLYVENFDSQHAQANKLNKELNKYLHCLKETQKSSKTFYDTLKETFESNWPMSSQFGDQIELLEIKWADYLAKLNQDVQLPLVSYLDEFPELKKKIEKRCNRLLDFDNARHNLENAQHKTTKKNSNPSSNGHNTANTTKPGNTSGGSSSSSSSTSQTSTDQLTKLTKLQIDLEDKQHIYEEINQTLCMALPVLFENRIKFYSSLFQTFFHTETIFHSECVESKSKLDEICEDLSIKTNSQMYIDPDAEPEPEPENEQVKENAELNEDSNTILNTRNLPSIDGESLNENDHENNDYGQSLNRIKNTIVNDAKNLTEFAPKSSNGLHSSNEDFEISNKPLQSSVIYTVLATQTSQTSNGHNNVIEGTGNKKEKDEKTEQQSSLKEIKNRLLHKVRATYAYDSKEVDELTFVKDDLITVVECSESEKEDLDDGWLIGIHEATNKRGLFPENFTKRI